MARQKKGAHSMKKDKPAVSTSTKPRRKRWTSDDTELTLLGLPAAIWYAVFCYLPMFGLIIAFKNFKITPGKSFLYSLFHSDWAGFDNFKFFLTSNTFAMLLRNTLLYNILFIVLNIVIPVTLAVLINQIYSRIASKAYQTMMFFPYFLSWVVVSYFVYAFLNPDKGLMNTIIQFFGGDKIMWYSQPKWWPLILTFMQVWKSMGYNMVVYLASITGIDSTLYEAATLDGATKWQQTKYITLPALKPIIVMMFILNTQLYTSKGEKQMKKFNKVLALGMAGSMALSMAACGGSSSSASTGTDGSSTSTAAPTAAPSKDVVTLKWVAVGSGMPSNYDAWLAQINPYLEDKIGVNIDMEVISWGDWDTRRNVIVNTSGEYDILFTNVNTYNNDVNA